MPYRTLADGIRAPLDARLDEVAADATREGVPLNCRCVGLMSPRLARPTVPDADGCGLVQLCQTDCLTGDGAVRRARVW